VPYADLERRKAYAKAYSKDWAAKNPDRIKVAQKKYYLTHRDQRLENHKQWAKENKEHINEYQRRPEYREKARVRENRRDKTENRQQWVREYREQNRELINARHAVYMRNSPPPEELRRLRADYMRVWRQGAKARYNFYSRALERRFHWTRAEFDAAVLQQEGRCAICGDGTNQGLCPDHNHTTNRPRGLLCDECNKALGGFRDDPTRLQSAIEYVRRYE